MKNLIAAACTGLIVSMPSFASEADASNLYLGIGRMNVESGNSEYALKSNFINIGYNLTENISAEFQASESYTDYTEIIPADPITRPYTTIIENSLQTMALYAVYRTSGNFYAKAKAGYMQETYHDKASFMIAHSKESTTDSDWAAGAGLGYKFGHARVELEYTTKSGPVDLDYTSLGIIWGF